MSTPLQILSSNPPLLDSRDEVGELGKRGAHAPDAQPHHVGHVLGLASPRGRGVDHPGFGQLVLQLQHGQTRLGGLGRPGGTQVLRPVTLVEDNLNVYTFVKALQAVIISFRPCIV